MMPDIAVAAVLVAAVVAFVLSGVWYTAFGAQLAAVRGGTADASMPPWRIGIELVRSLVLAAVLAGVSSRADVGGAAGALLLGLVLWLAFPLVLWTGAIIHEGTPWRLAAIHGGDWLVKLLAVAVIVTIWR